MRGLKFEDLLSIVDFLYYGEANIYQENLDAFLNIAEELELKGLNGGEGGSAGKEREQEYPAKYTEDPINMNHISKINRNLTCPQNQPIDYESYPEDHNSLKTMIALPKEDLSGDLKDLVVKVNSMIGRGENMVRSNLVRTNQMIKAFVCQVCGKEGLGNQIRRHIEANHIEGISIPCNSCDKTVSTRNALSKHNSKHHINILC